MPPTLTRVAPIGTVTVKTGEMLSLQYTGQDDGLVGPLQYVWEHVEGPGEAVFTNETYPITMVVFDSPGTHTLRLSAYDGEFTASAELSVNVTPSNLPPVLANPISDQPHLAPDPYSFTFAADTFAEPDGQPLTYTAMQADGSALPGWLNFEADTRTFAGTPSRDAAGPLDLRVRACDPEGAFATADFRLTLVTAPQFVQGTSASVTMSEDGSPTPFVLSLTASEPDGDALAWSISTPASKGTASLNGSGLTRTVDYLPNLNYFGPDSFIVRIADPSGNEAFFSVAVTVQPVNDPPVLTGPLFAPAAYANQPYTWALPAGAFVDPDDSVLSYTATLSSRAALPAWLSLNAQTGTFSGTPGPADVGTLTLRITATDATGAFAQGITTLVIHSPAVTLYWGGGVSDLSGTSISTRCQTAENMAGVWNLTTKNWNESLSEAENYRAWDENNIAAFVLNIASGANPDVELASNMNVAGITAEFATTALNQVYDLISTTADNRTITLAPTAEVTLRTAASTSTFNLARVGHVSGRGGVILGGTNLVLNSYTLAGVPERRSILAVSSSTLSGKVAIQPGTLAVGNVSSGASGMPQATLFEVSSPNSIFNVRYNQASNDFLGNSAVVRLALGSMNLQVGADNVAPNETIGRLILEGSGILATHLNRSTSTVTGVLNLANGLDRGTNGKGVLVTEAPSSGGLGRVGGVRLIGHGLSANTLIP